MTSSSDVSAFPAVFAKAQAGPHTHAPAHSLAASIWAPKPPPREPGASQWPPSPGGGPFARPFDEDAVAFDRPARTNAFDLPALRTRTSTTFGSPLKKDVGVVGQGRRPGTEVGPSPRARLQSKPDAYILPSFLSRSSRYSARSTCTRRGRPRSGRSPAYTSTRRRTARRARMSRRSRRPATSRRPAMASALDSDSGSRWTRRSASTSMASMRTRRSRPATDSCPTMCRRGTTSRCRTSRRRRSRRRSRVRLTDCSRRYTRRRSSTRSKTARRPCPSEDICPPCRALPWDILGLLGRLKGSRTTSHPRSTLPDLHTTRLLHTTPPLSTTWPLRMTWPLSTTRPHRLT
jgi:hypothetical protein